jgi:preprotein translocase subunit SecF
VLPVGSILFIGSVVLGAGTLRDIALALFIGMVAGTYSSVFIASPMYVHLRENEPENRKQGHKVKAPRPTSGAVR